MLIFEKIFQNVSLDFNLKNSETNWAIPVSYETFFYQ